ncbi:MAG: hypothetical protein ACOH5I_10415 [Oligoflexus sp.]
MKIVLVVMTALLAAACAEQDVYTDKTSSLHRGIEADIQIDHYAGRSNCTYEYYGIRSQALYEVLVKSAAPAS